MRSRIPCIVSLLALSACGGQPQPPVDPQPDAPGVVRETRIARTLEDLRSHVERVEAQGLQPLLFEAWRGLLASKPSRYYVSRPPFGISRRDLRFLVAWNDPSAPAGAASDGPSDLPHQVLVDLSQQLRDRGIEFLVVPIPRTPQVYPERTLDMDGVPDGYVGADLSMARFLTALAEQGVEVLHLTPHFVAARENTSVDQDRYLFHNHNNHWTPRAVRITADLIAERISSMPSFERGPLTEGRDWVRKPMSMDFPMPVIDGVRSPPSRVWPHGIFDEAGTPAFRSNPSSPVLLLGDSNMQWYASEGAALPDEVAARLGREVDVIALSGSRTEAVWNRLIRRRPGRGLDSKQVVVWVFEASLLAHPDMRRVDLDG